MTSHPHTTHGRAACADCPADEARAAHCPSPAAADVARRAAVERAIARMTCNLADPQYLSDHARAGLFSPFHFHRVFRSVTSVTPARFLAALRMAAAQRLIIRDSPRIIDVCTAVGYSSLGTFTTQFTRLVGVSPRRYLTLVERHGRQRMGALTGHAPSAPPVPAAPAGGVLSGEVLPAPGDIAAAEGLLCTGMFRHGVPQEAPVSCTWGTRPGRVELPLPSPPVRSEVRQILSVWFPAWLSVVDALLDSAGTSRRVGATAVSLGASDCGAFRVCLRRTVPSDPPLVYALPLLLAEVSADRSASGAGGR
ncbi:AraC family transcriptional regulator [Streptomyces sp. NPDC032161]|uniref:helix-turn-helix transcriptional regulator n=1 Tax=unclassified Streptomyces TaxID=2593676 RepID=UPI0033E3ADA6